MKCQSCNSDRILEISGKTSDACWARYKGKAHDGYVPTNLGIDWGGGDYLEFNLCLECGQIQGEWPRQSPEFEGADEDDEDESTAFWEELYEKEEKRQAWRQEQEDAGRTVCKHMNTEPLTCQECRKEYR